MKTELYRRSISDLFFLVTSDSSIVLIQFKDTLLLTFYRQHHSWAEKQLHRIRNSENGERGIKDYL